MTDGSPESESIVRLLIEVDRHALRGRGLPAVRFPRRHLPQALASGHARSRRPRGRRGPALAACTREPEAQSFGTAFPEPARGLLYANGGRCHLDIASGTPIDQGWRTDSSKPIWISGWALEDPAKPGSEWVVVELAAPGDRARYLRGHDDPQAARRSSPRLIGDGPGVRNAAFELVARADALPRGRYAVRVLMRGGTAAGLRDRPGARADLTRIHAPDQSRCQTATTVLPAR